MQFDVEKAAPKDVNEVTLKAILSTAGVSKTIMGIEESGTTRETANTQKELMMENQIIPRTQMIIDALNQDYIMYSSEYESNEAEMFIDSPLAVDHEAEIKNTEYLTKEVELYDSLLRKGYDPELVSQYINGEIGVDQLGEPERPEPIIPVETDDEDEEEVDNSFELPEQDDCSCSHIHNNQIEEFKGQVQQQEGSLKNSIINIEQQVVAEAISNVQKKVENQLDEETDIIGKRAKSRFENQLEAVLVGFYGIIMNLEGGKVMRKRTSAFALPGIFKLNNDSKKYISQISEAVAESHISTVTNDIWKTAREAALQGKGQREIIREIKNKYDTVVSETRAKTIARTETNRAFTMAQYDADRQFVKQNDLQGRVFKQWKTRSDNPCPFCQALEDEGPVPFGKNFRSLGDTISVDGQTLDVNFQPLVAGNAHPNCACTYEIIIEPEQDNSIGNAIEAKQKLQKEVNKLEKELQEFENLV
jgi:hypothetical protein